MNQGSNEVQISNKICRRRVRFDESMLTGVEMGLKLVGYFLVYDNLECFGKVVENRDLSVIIHLL